MQSESLSNQVLNLNLEIAESLKKVNEIAISKEELNVLNKQLKDEINLLSENYFKLENQYNNQNKEIESKLESLNQMIENKNCAFSELNSKYDDAMYVFIFNLFIFVGIAILIMK